MRVEIASGSNNSQNQKKEKTRRWVLVPFFGIIKMFHTIFIAPVLGCFLRLIFFLVFIFFLFSFLLIKSGLWEVPYLTSLIYTPEGPSQQIVAISQEKSLEYMSREIAQVIYKRSESLSVSGEVLTGLLQSKVLSFSLPIEKFQIAVISSGMEAYMEIGGYYDTVIRTVIHPYVEKGSIKYEISDTYLGDLPFPSVIIKPFIQSWLKTTLNPLLAQIGEVRDVQIKGGYIQVLFE